MQKITQPQGDAVLDVVCQCRVVSQAWEQSQAAEKTAEVEAEQEAYHKALEGLTDFYVKANELGVDDSVLIGVLTRNLPGAVFASLTPKTAA